MSRRTGARSCRRRARPSRACPGSPRRSPAATPARPAPRPRSPCAMPHGQHGVPQQVTPRWTAGVPAPCRAKRLRPGQRAGCGGPGHVLCGVAGRHRVRLHYPYMLDGAGGTSGRCPGMRASRRTAGTCTRPSGRTTCAPRSPQTSALPAHRACQEPCAPGGCAHPGARPSAVHRRLQVCRRSRAGGDSGSAYHSRGAEHLRPTRACSTPCTGCPKVARRARGRAHRGM